MRQRDRKELDCMKKEKKKKKKKKKKKVFDCMKLEYYKEVLDFSNIEYYIIFLITQISVGSAMMAIHKEL